MHPYSNRSCMGWEGSIIKSFAYGIGMYSIKEFIEVIHNGSHMVTQRQMDLSPGGPKEGSSKGTAPGSGSIMVGRVVSTPLPTRGC